MRAIRHIAVTITLCLSATATGACHTAQVRPAQVEPTGTASTKPTSASTMALPTTRAPVAPTATPTSISSAAPEPEPPSCNSNMPEQSCSPGCDADLFQCSVECAQNCNSCTQRCDEASSKCTDACKSNAACEAKCDTASTRCTQSCVASKDRCATGKCGAARKSCDARQAADKKANWNCRMPAVKACELIQACCPKDDCNKLTCGVAKTGCKSDFVSAVLFSGCFSATDTLPTTSP
jgi:hypothetical protein